MTSRLQLLYLFSVTYSSVSIQFDVACLLVLAACECIRIFACCVRTRTIIKALTKVNRLIFYYVLVTLRWMEKILNSTFYTFL